MDPKHKYKGVAEALAAFGRNGDSILMHVNPVEVQALNSLAPGSITINPETGQPEAFFWMIPALIQGALAAVGSAGSAVAGGLGATSLASGITSTIGGIGSSSGLAGLAGSGAAALGAPAGLTSFLGGTAAGGGVAAPTAGGAAGGAFVPPPGGIITPPVALPDGGSSLMSAIKGMGGAEGISGGAKTAATNVGKYVASSGGDMLVPGAKTAGAMAQNLGGGGIGASKMGPLSSQLATNTGYGFNQASALQGALPQVKAVPSFVKPLSIPGYGTGGGTPQGFGGLTAAKALPGEAARLGLGSGGIGSGGIGSAGPTYGGAVNKAVGSLGLPVTKPAAPPFWQRGLEGLGSFAKDNPMAVALPVGYLATRPEESEPPDWAKKGKGPWSEGYENTALYDPIWAQTSPNQSTGPGVGPNGDMMYEFGQPSYGPQDPLYPLGGGRPYHDPYGYLYGAP